MSKDAIRHLTAADYRRQPWANGRGETLELARADDDAGILWRLSVAMVAEDGPFSLFPGVDRILTVIEGPGFDLAGGGLRLEARSLVPVAFPGDVPIEAVRVAAPSRDFNVMAARGRVQAGVRHASGVFSVTGGAVALHALAGGTVDVNGATIRVDGGDTILASGALAVTAGAGVLAVTLDRTA